MRAVSAIVRTSKPLLAFLAVLAACAGGAAAQKVTITVAVSWEPGFMEVQRDFDRRFMERHPDIEVELIEFAPSLDWYLVRAAGNAMPDVFYVSWIHGRTLAGRGITRDLTDLIERTPSFNYADIFPAAQSPFETLGGAYGIAYDAGPVLPYYHGVHLLEAGLAVPDPKWTIEDFLEYSRRLTRRGPDNEVIRWGSARLLDGEVINAALGVFGGAILNEDETESLIASPASIEALDWWTRLHWEHGVNPGPGVDHSGLFINGQASINFGGSWMMERYSVHDLDTNVAAFPVGPAGQTASIAGSGFAISRNTAQLEAAWTYLSEYLSSENVEAMWGRSGRGSPSRRSAWPAFGEAWLNRNSSLNIYAFMEALDYGSYIRPLGPYASEILGIVSQGVNEAWAGNISAREAALQMHERITALISN